MVDDRLLETSDLPLERELLRAAAEEVPPSATRVRSLAALGLLGVATPAAAAVAGASTTSTTTSAGAAGALGLHWLFKWGLVLGIGATAVGGAIVVERSLRPVDSTAVATAVESTAAMPRTEASAAAPTPLPNADEQQDEAVESSAPPSPPRQAQPSVADERDESKTAAASAAVSIREEVRLLDRARVAVARDAPDAALATLAEYSARFPTGTLREEAAVIRIEALRASGRQRAALREQHEFQRDFPSSAHQVDAGVR